MRRIFTKEFKLEIAKLAENQNANWKKIAIEKEITIKQVKAFWLEGQAERNKSLKLELESLRMQNEKLKETIKLMKQK